MADHKHLRVSWSGMLRFEECHRQDALIRSGERIGSADKRNFLAGNVVDNTMREWLDQDAPKAGDLIPRMEANLERVVSEDRIIWRGSEATDRERVVRDCREALERLEPWLFEHVIPYPYQPEARGYVPIEVPDFAGRLQRIELFYATDILVKPDQFIIYDLKTTRNESYIRGKTLGQLVFYALGVAAQFKIPLREVTQAAFLTPLCKNITTPIFPTEDDFRSMVQRITKYANAVWAGYAPTKAVKDSDCSYRCEVSHACPLGTPPLPGTDGRVSFVDLAKTRKGGSDGFRDPGALPAIEGSG